MDHSVCAYMRITELLSSSAALKEQHSESHLDLPQKIFISAGLNLFCHIAEPVHFRHCSSGQIPAD